jgi:hypothetical protein
VGEVVENGSIKEWKKGLKCVLQSFFVFFSFNQFETGAIFEALF